jgi:hypothetical protein
MLLNNDDSILNDFITESPSERLSTPSLCSLPVKPFSKAFSSLQETMEDCLYSRSKPLFYIFSGDAGSGKSTTVHDNVKGWKKAGFPGDGSILIILGTFKEIDSYRAGCGLDDWDFACVSSDHKYNAYGLGRGRANEAKVLFTTHEQVRSRIFDHNGFEAATEFHYQGRARSLRLWDEGISAASPVSFKLDGLNALPSSLSADRRNDEFIRLFRSIGLDKAALEDGAILSFPSDLRGPARAIAIDVKSHLPKDVVKALEGVSMLAGQQAVLRRDNLTGLMVVGIGQPLPDDLAPLVVFDASARLKPSYRYWADRSHNVRFLPKAIADYSSLELHWWDKSAGKSALAVHSQRAVIVEASVELLNSRDDEDWLVIHQKEVAAYLNNPGYCIARDIEAGLNRKDRVKFLHWGNHIATNDYRHIRNVLIIGGNQYPNLSYEAIYMAATGQLTSPDKQRVNEIGAFEFAHHVYQAACRSNLRQMVGEVAGSAKVYLIAANRAGREEAIEAAFRGCTIHQWQPLPGKPKARVQIIMDMMLALFGDGRASVTTKALWQACGGKDSSYLKRYWDKPTIVRFMRDNGIRKVKNSLHRFSATI